MKPEDVNRRAARLAGTVERTLRGWVTMAGLLACVTLPVLWFERIDDDGDRVDEYGSVWGAVPAVFGSSLVPKGSDDLGDALVVCRVGLVVLALGLLGAVWVAMGWAAPGVHDPAVPRWLTHGSAALLAVGALVLLIGAGMAEAPGSSISPSGVGLGVGAGLWAPLFTALSLVARRQVEPD